MALGCSKEFPCVAVVFMVAFFVEAKCDVNREIVAANVGDNITLRCNPGAINRNLYWVKDNLHFIAQVNKNYSGGELYYDFKNEPSKPSYEVNFSPGQFVLYVYNTIAETAVYACRYGHEHLQEYDVRVIGCPACFANSSVSHQSDEPKMDVYCHLNNYETDKPILVNITLNRNVTEKAIISGNVLTFTISGGKLYKKRTIQVRFNPFTDTLLNISCIVSAQLTTLPSTLPNYTSSSTLSLTTLPITTSKASATTWLATSAKTSSRAAILATSFDSRQPKSPDPSYLKVDTTILATSNQLLLKNADSGAKYSGNITILQTVGLGSVFVILSVIIFVIRFRQRMDRNSIKTIRSETNGPVVDIDMDKHREETSRNGCGELMDNVLYESSTEFSRPIIKSPVSRSSDQQLDAALYTIPDRTGIINRVAKSTSDSLNVVSPFGKKVITSQKEDKEEDQHENADKPNLGAADGDREIPIYAKPDKGLRSARITTKTGTALPEHGVDIPIYAMPDKGPGATGKSVTGPGLSRDHSDGGEIRLYAVPDKVPKSSVGIVKATSGSGMSNDCDESPLYAMPDKGTGSQRNRSVSKTRPRGDHSIAMGRNEKSEEEALYAEVDN